MRMVAVAEEQKLAAAVALDDATRIVASPFDALRTLTPSTHQGPVPHLGQELGAVRLTAELGRGAMGVVFKGFHKELKRPVAIKVLTARSPAERDLGLMRLVDEARTAAVVEDSHLARVYGADISGPMPFLIMEYIDGTTLANVLSRLGHLRPGTVARVMADIAAGVAKLHGHHIVHRDLKPSNVLLDRSGRVIVSDFGLSVSLFQDDSNHAPPSRIAGTPAFMAPEMFQGKASLAADVYALGIAAFQLLTGKVPFGGTLEEIREQHQNRPLPVDELRAIGVSEPFIATIDRATRKNPRHRHASASELEADIRPLCVDEADARRNLADGVELLR